MFKCISEWRANRAASFVGDRKEVEGSSPASGRELHPTRCSQAGKHS